MSRSIRKQLMSLLILFVALGGLSAQPLHKGYKQTDIADLALIYQGGAHRMDWTADQFKPYVVHQDSEGRQDWLFDGFLFLEFKDGKGRCFVSGYEKEFARKQEWNWLIDRVFEKGKSLSALNESIGSAAKILGEPAFRHKVVIGLPEPVPGQKDWGKLDGKRLDFSKDEDKQKACLWYINELTKRFKEAGFTYLDLAGFYWVAEDIVTSKALTVPVGNYIRSQEYKFYWIPYWNAMGYSEWKELGFDMAYAQPNHFFDASITDDRIDKTCQLARTHNLGLEVEFDERVHASRENSFYNRLVSYLDRFERNDVFEEASVAYYEGGGAVISLSKSKDSRDKALMDRLARLIWKRRETKDAQRNQPVVGLDSSVWTVSRQTPSVVHTKSKKELQYGKVEVRARLLSDCPDTKVTIRLLPVNAPTSAGTPYDEITLMEYDGRTPQLIKGGIYSNELNWNTGNKKGATLPVSSLSGDYHSFICEWTPACIKLYVDDVLFFAMDDDFKKDPGYWPFNQPFYLEINTDSSKAGSVIQVEKVLIEPIPVQPFQIIPEPQDIQYSTGCFILNKLPSIGYTKELSDEARQLQLYLSEDFSISSDLRKGNVRSDIWLQLDTSVLPGKEEGYVLDVASSGITIRASSKAGIFNGIQTLRQIIRVYNGQLIARQATITDYPAFSWRAFMLDEARNFRGKKSVCKLLDEMALLKMNVFHWHLTDDQGWRIEIKKYPKLTEVGAFRDSSETGGYFSHIYDGKPHGGFYTQEEIKEIVNYAALRNIRIVPEIEMPGHCGAAIAAYPWLGTTGKEMKVSCDFGVQYASYNVSDPKVVSFLEDVLNEVITLFPGNTIHIGGDELNYEQWKNSSSIREYMVKNKLKTPADLQVFFTNTFVAFLTAKNQKLMGWNEITGVKLHDYQSEEDTNVSQILDKRAIVHFWKGEPALIKAAVEKGYDVVNSYHIYTYTDYASTSMESAYSFNPAEGVPAELKKRVLGMECHLWGEFFQTEDEMTRHIFPRFAAYAESGWVNPEKKDYKRFLQALPNFLTRWSVKGISCGPVR